MGNWDLTGTAGGSSTLCRVNPSFSWKKLAHGFIILDLEKGHYFTLNESASLIWNGLLEAKGRGAIADDLAREYDIARAQAEEDVKEVIDTLLAEAVLIPPAQDQPLGKQQKDT